jgi:hypothetical protein
MQFEVLKNFIQEGPLTVVVDGDCMQQTIASGSRLRLEGGRRYWPGDVIAFKRGDGNVVSHRFLGYAPGRTGWRVITRAENTSQVDVPVPVREVLGKVTYVDDELFNPMMKDRARAVAQYFAAVMRWLFSRLKTRKLRKHNG